MKTMTSTVDVLRDMRQRADGVEAISASGATIAASHRSRGGATGQRVALAAEVIREGHATSERGIRDDEGEARALIAELRAANAVLERPLALASEGAAIGEQLGAQGVRIDANYTVAAERDVHTGFLLPGMELLTAESEEEDELF
jgi:hypothetical protein